MKVSSVVLLATVVLAERHNNHERTITITKSGWDPRATHVYGRFDRTTRLTTTTVWSGEPPSLDKRHDGDHGAAVNGTNVTHGTSTSAKAGAGFNTFNWGIVGAVAAGAALLV